MSAPDPVLYLSLTDTGEILADQDWDEFFFRVAEAVQDFVDTSTDDGGGAYAAGAWIADPQSWLRSACLAVKVPAKVPAAQVNQLAERLRTVALTFGAGCTLTWAFAPAAMELSAA